MDSIQHYGVKGMKWGVRRYQNKDGTRITRAQSRAREREMSRKIKNVSNMTDDDIRKVTNRLRSENDLKRLTKNNKELYRNREKLTDDELRKKVNRLQLEENLRQQSNLATKQQKELALEVIGAAANIGLAAYVKGIDGAAKQYSSEVMKATRKRTKIPVDVDQKLAVDAFMKVGRNIK